MKKNQGKSHFLLSNLGSFMLKLKAVNIYKITSDMMDRLYLLVMEKDLGGNPNHGKIWNVRRP